MTLTSTYDPYTMELRLCDDDGMVSDDYLGRFNVMRQLGRNKQAPWPTSFFCTGSAHVAGEHVFCTSAYHGKFEWRALDCGSATRTATLTEGLTISPVVVPVRVDGHQARRGSDVEAFIREARERYALAARAGYPTAYSAIDDLLDSYRLHADTGTPLGQAVCDGPCSCDTVGAGRCE